MFKKIIKTISQIFPHTKNLAKPKLARFFFSQIFLLFLVLVFENSCSRVALPPPDFLDSDADFNANFDPSLNPNLNPIEALPGSIARPPLDPRLLSDNSNEISQNQNFLPPIASPDQSIPANLLPSSNQINSLEQNSNPQNPANIPQNSINNPNLDGKNNLDINQIYQNDIIPNRQNPNPQNFEPERKLEQNNIQNNSSNFPNAFSSSIIYRDEKADDLDKEKKEFGQKDVGQINPQIENLIPNSLPNNIIPENFSQPDNFNQLNSQQFTQNRELIKQEVLSQNFFPPIFVGEISSRDILKNDTAIEFDLSSISCNPDKELLNEIIYQLQNGGKNMAASLPDCLKKYRPLMLKMAIIKPSEFQFADEGLKKDASFVKRMIEIKPEILSYADHSLKNDPNFMIQAIFINRDALFYASEELLDKKVFIQEMIKIDSRNYIFASERLQKNTEFAASAFSDDGMLIKYAPAEIKSNLNLVLIAVKSDDRSFEFIDEKLKNNAKIKKLLKAKKDPINQEELKRHLSEHYIDESDKKNLSIFISNRLKFSKDYQIIDRNYITKWRQNYKTSNLELNAADSRNFHISWKKDFAKFPILIAKIEKFLLSRQIDQKTIDNLSTSYFFKVKTKPQTVLFNLYLLRKGFDRELGSKFSNITSLTAIAQKKGNEWNLSVVEVIFSNEIPTDISFNGGHKKYIFWDFYFTDKKDKNPKIIYKVEDRFNDYFEIFAEQENQKYRSIYKIDLIKELQEKINHPVKEIDVKIDRF